MRSMSNSDCNYAISCWIGRGPEGYERSPAPRVLDKPACNFHFPHPRAASHITLYLDTVMTIPTREWRKGFGHKCGTSIERPQDYSMLGSASRPILMDCEDDRASRPDDADGDAIPETPSHRPLSSVCYGSQSHFDFRTFRVSRTNFFDGRVSISYGEMAVQRSTNCECTPAISSFVEDPKSAVQNTNLGF